jgi:hypothetical protein
LGRVFIANPVGQGSKSERVERAARLIHSTREAVKLNSCYVANSMESLPHLFLQEMFRWDHRCTSCFKFVLHHNFCCLDPILPLRSSELQIISMYCTSGQLCVIYLCMIYRCCGSGMFYPGSRSNLFSSRTLHKKRDEKSYLFLAIYGFKEQILVVTIDNKTIGKRL